MAVVVWGVTVAAQNPDELWGGGCKCKCFECSILGRSLLLSWVLSLLENLNRV